MRGNRSANGGELMGEEAEQALIDAEFYEPLVFNRSVRPRVAWDPVLELNTFLAFEWLLAQEFDCE